MNKESAFIEAFRTTRIIRPPTHTIATFGTTTLRYVLLSRIAEQPDFCRLREGEVTAERPKILTPDFWKKRFEGFGEDEAYYGEELAKAYGEALKGLEYSFRNNLKNTSLEHASLPEVSDRTRKIMEQENAPRTSLLEGPDGQWSLSIMKFIVDMSLRSFPMNFRELEDRGLFDPGKRQENRERLEIEKLFGQAQVDRSKVSGLGDYLRRSGYFNDYEDRFFSLIQR